MVFPCIFQEKWQKYLVVGDKCGILKKWLIIEIYLSKPKKKEAVRVNLKQLLEGISYEVQQGTADVEISDFQYDSRKVEKDGLFVCITGFQTDGHKYIPMALEKGAVALLCEHRVENVPEGVTVLVTENNRIALDTAFRPFLRTPLRRDECHRCDRHKRQNLDHLSDEIHSGRIGKKVGIIGTIENRIGDEVLKAERTTPESKELQALFRRDEE